MDNHEFVMETYKPFDEYLKKHKYDPETNTIEIDGKRMMAGKKLSNKERNRINKFLREHDYDPKTETIRTEVKDFTNEPERIKFDITDSIENASFNYNPFFPDLGRKIVISQNELAKKPYISNWTFKHEEGHFNENNVKVTRDKLQDWIDSIQDALKVDEVLPQFENKQQMKDALKYFQQKLNSFDSKMNEIKKIKDKADLFNDEQIKRGNMPKREGSYKTDHDVSSGENYADYYATKHNKYGDPSKSTRGTLSSYIKFPAAMSKHTRNYVIDKYLGEEVHRDKIKTHALEILEKFEDPTVVARKLGLGKNMSDNEIRAMFKNHEDVVKIFNNRRNYVYNNIDYQTLTSCIDATFVDSNDYLDLKNKQKELKKSLVAEYKKKNPEETSKFDKIIVKEDEYMKKFFEGVSPKELAKLFSKFNSRYSLKRELGAEHRQAFVNSIKESCLIMDNDEFFMEASKYERRLQREFEKNFEKDPEFAKYKYLGPHKKSSVKTNYDRHDINRRLKEQKKIEKKEQLKNSKPKQSSSNKNKLKALNILDYDPKTNTIKGNVTLPDGSKKERVPYMIDNILGRFTGPCVTDFETIKSIYEINDTDSATEKAQKEKTLRAIEKFEKAGEEFIIVFPRKYLNQRHFAGVGYSLHELGHFNYIYNKSDTNETETARKHRDDMKDKLTTGTPSWKHLAEDPKEVIEKLGYDSSNEFSADKYAADRVGIRNYEINLIKLFNSSKFGIKKHIKPKLDKLLKTINAFNNPKEKYNASVIEKARKTAIEIAEDCSRSLLVTIKSTQRTKEQLKDSIENVAYYKKKIDEFTKRGEQFSEECKKAVEELERYEGYKKDELESLKLDRELVKSKIDSLDKRIDQSSIVSVFKKLRKEVENYKAWVTDYETELSSRLEYIKKHYTKKNINEYSAIDEMYIDNIITESEYIQLQERIQILTERSE